jgi:hypothetical protein
MASGKCRRVRYIYYQQNKTARPTSETVRSKKKKVKSLCLIFKALRHEGVWGSGCIYPHFLDLGISWRWVVSFTPRSLYTRYPLHRRMGGPQSRSGRRGEENILDTAETRTLTPRSSNPYPVAISSALSWLHYVRDGNWLNVQIRVNDKMISKRDHAPLQKKGEIWEGKKRVGVRSE